MAWYDYVVKVYSTIAHPKRIIRYGKDNVLAKNHNSKKRRDLTEISFMITNVILKKGDLTKSTSYFDSIICQKYKNGKTNNTELLHE